MSMEHLPLAWFRALSTEPGLLESEVQTVHAWLVRHGWTLAEDGGAWVDPTDSEGHTLKQAIRAQAARQAQAELEPRGWSAKEEGHWAPTEKLRRGRQRATILEALYAEVH